MAKRVVHTIRGFHMSVAYAEQVMREHCTITWDIPGVSVRDTTDAERMEMRAAQIKAAPLAIIPLHELPRTRFKGPLPNERGLVRAANFMLEQCVASSYMA